MVDIKDNAGNIIKTIDPDWTVKEDMICPATKKHCDDECCPPGAECNLKDGGGISDLQTPDCISMEQLTENGDELDEQIIEWGKKLFDKYGLTLSSPIPSPSATLGQMKQYILKLMPHIDKMYEYGGKAEYPGTVFEDLHLDEELKEPIKSMVKIISDSATDDKNWKIDTGKEN